MRTILFLIQKEFIQIKRNKAMLPIMFIMPLLQMIILVSAATFEMKNIRVTIVDKDMSSVSRSIISKFSGSPFYKITSYSFNVDDGEENLKKGNADMVLVIPEHFERKLRNENKCDIQLLVNAINAASAGLVNAYTVSILIDYNAELVAKWANIPGNIQTQSINTRYSYWYNPELNYKNYMVPGILVMLVTIIGLFLAGLNIVREKEIGTIEQINITPIKKYQFIIGKLFPFWLIALFELGFGLLLGKLIFGIPIVGNVFLLFLFAAIYLVVVLSLGLFVSTVNNTQQQAMFITWFFMVIFILMSGLFTPVESMPVWAQKINIINPVAYFIEVTRMVLLKGSGLIDIKRQLISISIYAVTAITIAVRRYRKVG
ncbi:MAG TPA: ABC transporter permease [Bacteroidales bacterium]|nr:ABC transporter permease [Bacteroidales bacterium]HPS15901.1 ABC transporter permease [Bacteroidales bacterium]